MFTVLLKFMIWFSAQRRISPPPSLLQASTLRLPVDFTSGSQGANRVGLGLNERGIDARQSKYWILTNPSAL